MAQLNCIVRKSLKTLCAQNALQWLKQFFYFLQIARNKFHYKCLRNIAWNTKTKFSIFNMARFVIAHWAWAIVALNPPRLKNRSLIFKFGNPSEFLAKVIICTRKQNPEGFWSYSKMTSSCVRPSYCFICESCCLSLYLCRLSTKTYICPLKTWKVSDNWSVKMCLCASLFLRSTNRHETSFKYIKDSKEFCY